MTLEIALDRYYNANDERVFKDIWNNIVRMINWSRYFDPTGIYTVEDLQQECSIQLWKKMDKYDKNRGSFKSFAITVVYTKACEIVRNILKKNRIEISDNKTLPLIEEDITDTLETKLYAETTPYDYMLEDYLKNAVVNYFNDPIIRDIFNSLINNEDNLYCANQNVKQSTLHRIAKEHNCSIKDIKNKINEYRKPIYELLRGE